MQLQPIKEHSFSLFDKIAPYYERLNIIFSLGIDYFWRKALLKKILPREKMRLLDVATGTGQILKMALKMHGHKNFDCIDGVDPSENMLAIAQKNLESQGQTKITLSKANAENLPFTDAQFDIVTVAFGVRNFSCLEKGLQEIARVLTPEGQMLILEFSLPHSKILSCMYLFYLRYFIAPIGKLISKHPFAYEYLYQSIKEFPRPESFIPMIRRNGFESAHCTSLCLGIVSIYDCRKS